MKNINYFSVLLFVFTQFIFAQVSPNQMVTNLGTGINLGNILSAPVEGNWAAPLTEDYIDNVARLKFKHVRIPIRFDNQTTPISSVTYTDSQGNYIGSPSNYAVNSTYLNRIEEIINWCIDRNLIAIIDVHGDHWFWESFDNTSTYYATGNDRLARIDRFKAIWRDIAVRFQTKPNDKLLFELMNEPFFSMSASEVNSINTQLLSLIRTTNPSRCVIVTGGGQNSFQAPMQLSSSFIQSDNYLIATFHYYKPFAFTSSASQNYTDDDWGTPADQSQVQSEFDQVYNWSLQNNIPIYLGEFGADNVNGYNYFTQTNGLYGGPDEYSRKFYHQFISNYARSKGFALSVWDSGEKSGKTLYLNTTKTWVKDVRNAVLGSNCSSNFLIKNADIECNYDYNWTIQNNNSSIAKINNATNTNSYLNSSSIEIKVDTSPGAFDDIMMLNEQITTGFTTGTNYTVSCYAKGNNNQQFKFRIKCTIGGSTTFLTSPALQLSSDFSQFNYSFTIPSNTSILQFQVLCGEDVGSYFFDTFHVANTLNNPDFINSKIIYPNPSNGNLEFYLQGVEEANVIVYNLLGQSIPISVKKLENSILVKPLQNLTHGVYLVNIISDNKTQQVKWIVN
jgi:endoglucanase